MPPVMEEYGFKATMFVISRLADGRCPHMQHYGWLDWDQLGTLRDHGWEIGAHTATHSFVPHIIQGPDGAPLAL